MAILGITSLTGCDSIPSFIATGSRMVFQQGSAPSPAWTKETNAAFNDIALKVTTSPIISFGGSSPFITVFPDSQKGLSAYSFSGPAGITLNAQAAFLQLQAAPSVAASSSEPLTVPQMVSHAHTYQRRGDTLVQRGSASTQNTPLQPNDTYTTANEGGGGGHSHGISDSQHANHPISPGDHQHPITEPAHTHQFQMTARNFRLLYVDVIICTKN